MPLTFSVPQQFQEISLTDSPEQRARRQYDALTQALRGIKPSEGLYMVLAQEMALANLIRAGTIYVATCFAKSETDPTRGVTAHLSVLIKEATLHGNRPLVDVARGLNTPGEPREIIFNEFPAGEALVIGEELLVTQPTTVSGSPTPQKHRIRQAQVIFALPGNEALAIFSMSSPSLDDWPHFMAVLNGISHSVSLADTANSVVSSRLECLV